jgi:hopanoid biosynthesis associated protein HpnK
LYLRPENKRHKDKMARTLIVTADDFGLDLAVNEAVEQAHRDGILTCASLMVGAPAAADAVARARRLPRLGVGLHLTLVDGVPTLPADAVPDLVDPSGRFPADPFRQGVRIFCSPRARAQLAAEIRAQFEAFRATGLPLDHVDGHHHFHIHPTIQRHVLALLPEYGRPAVRVPLEPAADGAAWSLGAWSARRHARRLRRRLARIGAAANDAIYGVAASGHMDRAQVGAALARVGEGVSELYLHPVARAWQPGDPWPAGYDGMGELAALIDPELRRIVAARGIRLATFSTARAA